MQAAADPGDTAAERRGTPGPTHCTRSSGSHRGPRTKRRPQRVKWTVRKHAGLVERYLPRAIAHGLRIISLYGEWLWVFFFHTLDFSDTDTSHPVYRFANCLRPTQSRPLSLSLSLWLQSFIDHCWGTMHFCIICLPGTVAESYIKYSDKGRLPWQYLSLLWDKNLRHV